MTWIFESDLLDSTVFCLVDPYYPVLPYFTAAGTRTRMSISRLVQSRH